MRQILITYLDEVVLCFELLYDLKKLRGFNVFCSFFCSRTTFVLPSLFQWPIIKFIIPNPRSSSTKPANLGLFSSG